VLKPAHVFVLLLKTAVKAKVKAAVEVEVKASVEVEASRPRILLLVIQWLFVVVCDCLPLCAIVLPCAHNTTDYRLYLSRIKRDWPHFSPLTQQQNIIQQLINQYSYD
jgi:ABC-type Fe3+ transport system permease subunit